MVQSADSAPTWADPDKPEYTQTIGWQLAEATDSISSAASDAWDWMTDW